MRNQNEHLVLTDPYSIDELIGIIDKSRTKINDEKPSEWSEKNRYMTSDFSAIPGYFSFENTPYTRELIDFFSQFHPGKIGAIRKASQLGISTSVIENVIGWIISQQPGNILFLVGHDGLIEDAVSKVDNMLNSTKVIDIIGSKSNRSSKTGNTDKRKEFPGGFLKIDIANHKILQNISIRYGLIDDFERMRGSAKESGDTFAMVENRFKAFKNNMKLMFVSSPEIKEGSNINKAYLNGDQRKYFVPAPCCGTKIVLDWMVDNKLNTKEKAGITWKLDENNELIEDSVGYICQECGNFFDDRDKTRWINQGEWIPTARPSRPGYYSWHLNALCAPNFMYGWLDYVRQWLEAHPIGQVRDEEKYKTFMNQVLGECYEPPTESISGTELQKNIREYEVGIIPEKISIKDGNGQIVLITCGIDLNGVEEDARIDYEIKAWSESESNYSITHGSIGTFIPNDRGKTDRETWTYRHGAPNSVWPVLYKILTTPIQSDSTIPLEINFTCLDTGWQEGHAFEFINKSGLPIVGVKGDDGTEYVPVAADRKTFRPSKRIPNLFLLETNYTKDLLAQRMNQKWNPSFEASQPSGFMNFPLPAPGKYLYENFFAHFEAEEKVFDEVKKKYTWKKKQGNPQNHLFDCTLYTIEAKNIFLQKLFLALKIRNGSWQDYVNHWKNIKEKK